MTRDYSIRRSDANRPACVIPSASPGPHGGQTGDDTITGGTGFDYLHGDAGADTFIFKKGDSADWILDFKASDGDKVRFEGFGFGAFEGVPFVDLSTPGRPAVQMTHFNTTTNAFDQLTVFGVTLAQLNATNVLIA